MEKDNFYQGYVQMTHDNDVDKSGNAIPVHDHRVDSNPYDAPPDDLPEGYTPNIKASAWAYVIWNKLPQLLLYVGLCVFILALIWGCHHG